MIVFWILVLVTATLLFVGYPFLKPAPRTGKAGAGDAIEQEVMALRQKRSSSHQGYCSQCGVALRPSDRFCPECGAKVAQKERRNA